MININNGAWAIGINSKEKHFGGFVPWPVNATFSFNCFYYAFSLSNRSSTQQYKTRERIGADTRMSIVMRVCHYLSQQVHASAKRQRYG